jgi:hypothetical protein
MVTERIMMKDGMGCLATKVVMSTMVLMSGRRKTTGWEKLPLRQIR